MSRVLISMPDTFLEMVDKIAGTENRTRSELIREAVRGYIRKNEIQDKLASSRNAEILEELLG